MQVLEPSLEACLIARRRHAIHAGGGLEFERVERRPQRFDTDVKGSAVNCSFFLSFATFRTRSSAWVTRARSVPGASFAAPRFPWSPALAPPTSPPVARLCSSTSQLLCRSLTSLDRTSATTAHRLSAADHTPRVGGLMADPESPGSVQGASVHARVYDHAGPGGHSQ